MTNSRATLWLLLVSSLVGCAVGGTRLGGNGTGFLVPSHGVSRPDVVQNGPPLTMFGFVGNGKGSGGIAVTIDGSLWMTTPGGGGNNALTVYGMGGPVTSYMLGALPPGEIVRGADNKLYVGQLQGNPPPGNVSVISGRNVSYYPTPSGDFPSMGFVLGPDGNVWFVESAHVGKITTAGTITEYPYPGGRVFNMNSEIAVGPDGNLWLTESRFKATGLFAKLDPATGKITEYPSTCSSLGGLMLSNPDGYLYTFCDGSLIQFTTQPAVHKTLRLPGFPATRNGFPQIDNAGRGKLWFVDSQGFSKLDTATGIITSYNLGFAADALKVGPDKNIWTVEGSANTVAVYALLALYVLPQSVTLAGPGSQATLTATYTGKGRLTVSSSSNAVSVAPGKSPNTWVVTAVAAGNATITVSDSHLNSFNVSVTVI